MSVVLMKPFVVVVSGRTPVCFESYLQATRFASDELRVNSDLMEVYVARITAVGRRNGIVFDPVE